MDKSEKKVFIFDAFGTLFKTSDFLPQLELLVGDQASSIIRVWRQKQLEYTWLYNQMNQYEPFDVITASALKTSLSIHAINESSISRLLLPVFNQPVLIDNVQKTLQTLREQDRKIAILSNGTPEMLQKGVGITGISSLVDSVISVDDIKLYKPHPRVYAHAVNKLDEPIERCLFISSNQWDVAGANAFGLDTVWVNQHREAREDLPFGRMTELSNLTELAYL